MDTDAPADMENSGRICAKLFQTPIMHDKVIGQTQNV